MKLSKKICSTLFSSVFVILLTLTLISSIEAKDCVQPPDDLVAWWPFDEEEDTVASDIIGMASGILTGTASVTGRVSNAREFIEGDLMVANGGGDLDITGDQVTIDAWIKLENNPTNDQRFTAVIGKNGFPDRQPYQILFESGSHISLPQNQWQFEYILTNSDGERVHNQSTDLIILVDGQYHHFAMTYDGSSVKLYVDGVVEKTFAFSGNLKSVPLESATVSGSAPFSIDEAEIFNRSLLSFEIHDIYMAGNEGKCKPGSTLVAVAGTSLDEEGLLQLDGSQSTGPDDVPLIFSWEIEGESEPRFGEIVSIADLEPGTYTVTLTVSDSENSSIDTILVEVPEEDLGEPVAVAGTSVDEDNLLQLDGTLSTDPDDDPLTFSWQIEGESEPRTGEIVSIADLEPGNYEVVLTVSDGENSSTVTMLLGVPE